MLNLQEFEPLSPAEEKLVEAVRTGARATIGDGVLPEAKTDDVVIRAGVVRLLLLNTDPSIETHSKGVRCRGAYIVGRLDMQGADCTNDLILTRCVLEKEPTFLNARMRGLYLAGCTCPGLTADNASFDGSIFLRSGFNATGEISLPGARITGDLQICDAQLDGGDRAAVFANSVRVGGSIYLGDYPFDTNNSSLIANGALIFSNAVVEQDFFCRNISIGLSAQSVLPVSLQDGAEGGNTVSLSLVRAVIRGVYYSKSNQITGGIVNLSGAQVRRLNDDPGARGEGPAIRLDGFEYQDFAQHTDASLETRLAWLEHRPVGIEFRAQPYEHLARILLKIGHRDDANAVLMEKERLQRQANRKLAFAQSGSWGRAIGMALRDRVYQVLIGYGYQPMRILVWTVLLILAGGGYFQKVWNMGDMTPAAAPILVSASWVSATQSHPANPGAFWTSNGQAGQDYETFNAVAYSADLLVPLINLGQEEAWGPSTSRSPWGWHGWWIRWVAKVIGWVVTALAAAAVTGVIRRE